MRSAVELFDILPRAEQKRDTPNARQGDDGVDDAGQESVLTAADPRDNIEGKQSDAAPVECADDGDDQRDAIHNHGFIHPFLELSIVCRADGSVMHVGA